jgi:membrane-associated phospholipid phosphatase
MAEREQTPSAGAPADTSADPTTTPPAPEQAEAERVARVLTDEIERIDSPEAADEVVRELEALAGDATTGERAASAAEAPETASEAVQAAAQAPGPVGTAAALTEAAAQIVAPTPESPAVAKAAADVLPPRDVEASPRTERGRRLLRDAMLRRMKPIQAIDTRLFLAVNCLSHPPASDAIADTITIVTTGGWIWLIGLGAAQAFGVRKSGHALRLAIPSVIIATWFVENPIKALFRRRRPFIDIVRTLVVGRRPDGWSFPSGHSAAAFSGAWILSTVWPRATPIFFALASLVGFSRVYVGAHYPSDVLTGATLGTVVAEAIHRPVARYLRSR